jgi:peptidoglycan/xylan/chitin deacetylase (PgdA/CDA1 family)
VRRVALVAALVAVALTGGALPTSAHGEDAPTFTVHNFRGAVPVLCYHGIYTASPRAGDIYSVSQAEFGRQMAMLAAEGFHAISMDQFVRFAAGDAASLPDRPILITFDDGRIDSFANADPVLARYGMRASMFVITVNASAPKPGYLGWPALRAMAASGRWDLQLHANAGHVLIPTGPGGQTGPYYANLQYRNGVRERFTAFKRRVTEDILAGRRIMASQIPGFQPLGFAVPYSNYGQTRSNYAPIGDWELDWLERTFGAVFVQDRRVYNLPGSRLAQRYGVHRSTTAAALRQWLVQMLPRSAWLPDAAIRRTRPRRPSVRRVRRGRHTILISLRVRRGIELRATRRRAGLRHVARVRVNRRGRMRDRHLLSRTLYIYRITATDSAGRRSRALRLSLRTR